MKHRLLILVLFPLFAIAQTKQSSPGGTEGMKFEQGLTWSQVIDKAKKENKFIFVDAFTTWCGPCKYMSSNIFPLKEVGDYFNPKFLNVKVQIDSTNEDSEEIKRWYPDAHYIMKTYKVRSFPTYLFFDQDGNLVHRSGGSSDAKTFMATANDALTPEKQYYTLYKQYKAGNRDAEFLRNFLIAAYDAEDPAGRTAYEEYIKVAGDLLSKENIPVLLRYTNSIRDTGFKIMMQQPGKFNEVLGKPGMAEQMIKELLLYDHVLPYISSKTDFERLKNQYESQYPGYGAETVAKAKTIYFRRKNDWPNYDKATLEYMKAFGEKLPGSELNDVAWEVHRFSKSPVVLQEALLWSERSFKNNNNPMFIDTYAHLLYKLGRKDDAIKWQEKAVALSGGQEKNDYEATLNKMKRGEKLQ